MPARLGSFIRQRRLALGLTQEQLAQRIGPTIRQSEVSRLEHNRVGLPHRERMEALAAALEVSLGELLVRSNWMTDGDHLAEAVRTVEALATDDVRFPQSVTDLAGVVAEMQAKVADATQTIELAMVALARAGVAAGDPGGGRGGKLDHRS